MRIVRIGTDGTVNKSKIPFSPADPGYPSNPAGPISPFKPTGPINPGGPNEHKSNQPVKLVYNK